MKAPRNKTIDVSAESGKAYLEMCVPEAEISKNMTDCVIVGDMFSASVRLPGGFADLMIADPPYNLDKNFGTDKFKKTSDEDYEAYTEKWVKIGRAHV